MILHAIKRGVSQEKISQVLDIDVKIIISK